jgi:hypothetical protein
VSSKFWLCTTKRSVKKGMRPPWWCVTTYSRPHLPLQKAEQGMVRDQTNTYTAEGRGRHGHKTHSYQQGKR